MDGIFVIGDVRDRKAFLAAVLHFFAPLDVTLTTWGTMSEEASRSLKAFRLQNSVVRRLTSKEYEFTLSPKSLAEISSVLSQERDLARLKWGIRKGEVPLALCRGWDDIILDSSKLMSDNEIVAWLQGRKTEGIIDSYEKVEDKSANQAL